MRAVLCVLCALCCVTCPIAHTNVAFSLSFFLSFFLSLANTDVWGMVSFLDAHPEAIDSATILDIVNASTNGAVTPFFQMTVKHLMFGHFTTLNFSSPLIAAPSMIPGLSGFNATYDKDSLYFYTCTSVCGATYICVSPH